MCNMELNAALIEQSIANMREAIRDELITDPCGITVDDLVEPEKE